MYECPRCGYKCDRSFNFKKHLNKLTICRAILKDINLNNILIDDCKINELFNCEYCNEEYTLETNLNRHMKKCIKKKEKEQEQHEEEKSFVYLQQLVDKLNKQLEENLHQLEEKDKQINELIKKTGITNNITNNNNIFIYSLANTSLDHLTDKDMYDCVNSCILSVPNLVKNIHFNPNVPENHNIYLTNIRNNYIMVFNGKQWEIRNRDETIEDMININEFRLEDWVSNEEVQKMYPKAMKKFELYMKKREENGVIDTIKNEIKMLLYNKKDIVIETRNKNKKLVLKN